ncbi:unnamed protein product [Staurois parvus]|uniref:Retinol dehydrogenase 14 n=1 Tax=Staurois parvus TaxID=386267 RepID=A0ABN9HCA8_9NEOB|nr:unnamed protein product [Staurois parvus]
MSSVRAFTDRILRNEKRLDILVNNAGASGLPSAVTSEGLELSYATNHLGPFLLTNRLLELMKRSAPSRIVFLSSFMHRRGFADPAHFYGRNLEDQKLDQTYNCTKLMNIMCAREMAERLKTTGVSVSSVSPGIAMTEAMRHYKLILRLVFNVLGFFFFKTAEEGAASTIFCAVSEEAEGLTGKYVDSNCMIELPSEKALDPAVNKKLWEASEAATNLIGDPGQ